MTVFEKLSQLQTWSKENPKDKDVSDWVNEVLKQEKLEGRRAIMKLVPEKLKGPVAARVKFLFEKKKQGSKP